MQQYSIALFDIRDEDAPRVGSKAFNLMRLHRAGARVPDGFVVTAAAMERFMEDNNITRALSRLDVGGNPETLRRNARVVRSLFDEAVWPGELKNEIAGMARSLAGEQRGLSFAVRSSFSGEDGSVSSFAGQMASFLNIHAGEDLTNAIVRCWTSLWSQTAMAYRARRGAAEGATGGVLVQIMLRAHWSGVLFADCPIRTQTGALIEAVHRDTTGVVSGASDPHRLIIDRTSGEIVHYEAPRDAGYVMEPGFQATIASHSQKCIELGRPMDLGDFEWALTDDAFFLLQGRPLTTDAPDEAPQHDDIMWSRVLGEEFWSGTVTPAMFSIVGAAIERAMIRRPAAALGEQYVSAAPYLTLIHDHIFVNLSSLEPVVELIPQWALTDDFLKMFPADMRDRINQRAGLIMPVDLVKALWRFSRSKSPWTHAAESFNSFIDKHMDTVTAFAPPSPGAAPQEFRQSLNGLTDLLKDYLYTGVWGVTYAYLLVPLARRIIELWYKPEDRQRLMHLALSNLSRDRNFETSRRLTELADDIRRMPDRDLLKRDAPFADTERVLQKSPQGRAFLKRFKAFLVNHGHRTVDRDILYPRWGDDPRVPFSMLLNLAERGSVRPMPSPSDHEVLRELRKALPIRRGNLLSPMKGPSLKTIIHLSRLFLPVRENMRFYADAFLFAIRKLLLARAEGLIRSGWLPAAERDLVFFLRQEELFIDDEQACRSLLDTARKRRARFMANRGRRLPEYVFNGEDYDALQQPADDGNVLQGLPASPGAGSGAARLVHSYEDFFAFRPGDVLVVHALDPSWSSIIPLAAAVVTEVGGQLSHGAIVAREFGVPAVVGISNITDAVRNGDMLAVNGSTGAVTLSGAVSR